MVRVKDEPRGEALVAQAVDPAADCRVRRRLVESVDAKSYMVGFGLAAVADEPVQRLVVEADEEARQMLGDDLVKPLGMRVDLRGQPQRSRIARQVSM
jgi:hypothetical protein